MSEFCCFNPDFTQKYLFRKGFRGSGRMYAYGRLVGWDHLLIRAIRIKLRYPLGCPDIDGLISNIMLLRHYDSKWFFADHFDHKAVTFRK